MFLIITRRRVLSGIAGMVVLGVSSVLLWTAGAGQPAWGPVQVAVYHTHTTESFMPDLYGSAWRDRDPNEYSFTLDRARNMVRVGEALCRRLEELGINTVHDKTVHDVRGKAFAYQASRATVERLLGTYPTLRLVLDLHRDAPGRAQTVGTSAGAPTARIMFVIGRDNPRWRENYALAKRLLMVLLEEFPDLNRGIRMNPGKYNQDLAPHVLLVEVGGATASLEECIRGAERLAEVIARYLREQAPLRGVPAPR